MRLVKLVSVRVSLMQRLLEHYITVGRYDTCEDTLPSPGRSDAAEDCCYCMLRLKRADKAGACRWGRGRCTFYSRWSFVLLHGTAALSANRQTREVVSTVGRGLRLSSGQSIMWLKQSLTRGVQSTPKVDPDAFGM